METNFKTIKETKEEMQKESIKIQSILEELCNTVKNIAMGKNPEREIDLQNKYGVTFEGWSDIARNSLGLLWEYNNDIKTLKGQK